MKKICLFALLLMPAWAVEPLVLFDGKTFQGWEGNTTKVWRIVDGTIEGGSMAGNPLNEFLATEKSHQNFILKFQYKIVGSEGFVNGGVQFHSERAKKPANEMIGFQADIGAGYTGALCDESRRNPNVLVKPDPKLIQKIEKVGEWNDYEIRCEGAHFQLFVNGTRTVDYTEKDATVPLKGKIALQIHGNCKAVISFRNITLENLTPANESAKP